MRRLVAPLALVAALPYAALAQQNPLRPTAEPRPSFAEPGISPDGREIAFVSAGDVWTVPTQGGEARLLVAHPASESRPLYSPDGTQLAFVSNRAGGNTVGLGLSRIYSKMPSSWISSFVFSLADLLIAT